MAIVINEEQSTGGFFAFLLWIIVLGIIGAGFYYIFFKDPGRLDIVAPAAFQDTERISKIDLRPDDVVNDPRFTSLRDFLGPLVPGTRGRPNPFLAQ